jgi:hypothetical protein
MAYESVNRFVVTVKRKGTTDAPLSLVFHRQNILSWKLSGLRLPGVDQHGMPTLRSIGS